MLNGPRTVPRPSATWSNTASPPGATCDRWVTGVMRGVASGGRAVPPSSGRSGGPIRGFCPTTGIQPVTNGVIDVLQTPPVPPLGMVIIGAEVRGVGASGWSGKGPHFVVESCEFQRSFLDLSPKYAVILGIEPDHFDCYPQFDEAIAAYSAFAQKVPADGKLLIPAGSEPAKAACVAALAPVETFGVEIPADWQACDIRKSAAGTRFRIFHQGDYFTEVLLPIPGRHNVANALAAAALASPDDPAPSLRPLVEGAAHPDPRVARLALLSSAAVLADVVRIEGEADQVDEAHAPEGRQQLRPPPLITSSPHP